MEVDRAGGDARFYSFPMLHSRFALLGQALYDVTGKVFVPDGPPCKDVGMWHGVSSVIAVAELSRDDPDGLCSMRSWWLGG